MALHVSGNNQILQLFFFFFLLLQFNLNLSNKTDDLDLFANCPSPKLHPTTTEEPQIKENWIVSSNPPFFILQVLFGNFKMATVGLII